MIPIAAIIPALVLNFSPLILALLITIVGLLLFRIFSSLEWLLVFIVLQRNSAQTPNQWVYLELSMYQSILGMKIGT